VFCERAEVVESATAIRARERPGLKLNVRVLECIFNHGITRPKRIVARRAVSAQSIRGEVQGRRTLDAMRGPAWKDGARHAAIREDRVWLEKSIEQRDPFPRYIRRGFPGSAFAGVILEHECNSTAFANSVAMSATFTVPKKVYTIAAHSTHTICVPCTGIVTNCFEPAIYKSSTRGSRPRSHQSI
jgi:hypothetical protein